MDNKTIVDLDAYREKLGQKFKKIVPITIAVVIVLVLALSSVYMVDADSVGVVWTLGKITDESQPGINFKVPFVQQVDIVPVKQVLRRELGFVTVEQGGPNAPARYQSIAEQQRMLTGDENIVYVDFTVQYRISNPKNYLVNTSNPVETLDKASEAAMRLVVGEEIIDIVLTDGKALIQTRVVEVLQKITDSYGLGVTIQSVQLQDVSVPADVQPAFKQVVDAKEGKETKINNAERHRNTVVPQAKGEAERMVQEALGFREERIERAKGDVARFEAILAEYQQSKEPTKTRLYYEMLRQTLPNVDNIYITKDGDALKHLAVGGGN
ncbi:MAG: FtsH protease activity modulator HflK [Bacillota bacterium]|nr:FtsH protease activity modulator HflK [Bacillota bacterium]